MVLLKRRVELVQLPVLHVEEQDDAPANDRIENVAQPDYKVEGRVVAAKILRQIAENSCQN